MTDQQSLQAELEALKKKSAEDAAEAQKAKDELAAKEKALADKDEQIKKLEKAKPNEKPADPQAVKRQSEIVAVLKKLDSEAKLERKPSVNEMKNAVGYQITAEERDMAWNTFRPVEVARVAADPSKDWPQIVNKSKRTLAIGLATLVPGETKGVREWPDLKNSSHCVKEWLKAGYIAEA